MDELGFYVSFNSISVISEGWNGEHKKLCAMKRFLGSERISPAAGFKPGAPWSEVGSAKSSVTSRILRVWLGQGYGFEVCLERDRGINNIWNGEGV